MSNCNCCFEDYVVKCNTEIQAYLQLSPLTSYTWVITDKFDHRYEGEFTTDSDGFWVIPVSDLPPGLLTEYSGSFTLHVHDANCKPIKFKAAQQFDCVEFTVKGGTYEKNTLGCDFSCTPVAGDQNLLYPFEDQDVIEITWTSGLLASFGSSPSIQVYHEIEPNVYQLVDVAVQTIFTDGILTSILITNSGEATGYVLIS